MAEHAAAQRRNWLVALGAAVILLILLALTLSFCDRNGGAGTTAGPATTASSETLPPVSGPASRPASASASPGTLSPKTVTTADDPTTKPSPSHSASPSHRPSSKPDRTPAGGVDAGGGSGLDGRRLALLVGGAFLLLAAVITGRFGFGRAR
ncbi:translation initiation factor IF-2 [Actinoplanes sp. SE50]|uniref:hypothetical protein n=1 Tax=unclassified Actinoplanes TaxID=2626549 RepID=UPI00023ECE38|nr:MULTISPECIES: hypothetical protein [unclassified Actinoplanes]AEV83238.1 Translation initiation factor IF-2 [Actinoplanes sp. SE50/110]ATO81631.1 translation initiation factor IF-2 [Actinoplanes sp. SE50]SLL99039.1 translation initiation factor IF-2 [Actinoplanes sp. SE50/110]